MEKYLIFLIHKIGGAGLMLPYEKLRELVLYILQNKEPGTQIILVVSAFEMVTRDLQDIFKLKMSGKGAEAMIAFEPIKKLHLQRCADLFIEDKNALFDIFHEIEYFIRYGSIHENPTISKAHLLKFGELMSSEIINQFILKEKIGVKLIDAQNMIFAKGQDYCYSEPLKPETSKMISQVINRESTYDDTIILTQGYICNKRLLGLDGSDLTASLITYGLRSCNPHYEPEEIFWKNVDGVIVDGKVVDEISFNDYILLETVPVRKDAIVINQQYKPKIRIRSFLNLNHPGTLITW